MPKNANKLHHINFSIILTLSTLCLLTSSFQSQPHTIRDNQLMYKKRYQIFLQPNITKMQFTQDYALFIVIRSNSSFIYGYNPYSFEELFQQKVLIQKQQKQDNLSIMDFVLFNDNIFVLTSNNYLVQYDGTKDGKNISNPMIYDLKDIFVISGDCAKNIKMQRFKQDYSTKNSSTNSTRHFVIWSKYTYQIYQYQANQKLKLKPVYISSLKPLNQYLLTDIQFFDKSFYLYSIKYQNDSAGLLLSRNLTSYDNGYSVVLESAALSIKTIFANDSQIQYVLAGLNDRLTTLKRDPKNGSKIITDYEEIEYLGKKIAYQNHQLFAYFSQKMIAINWFNYNMSNSNLMFYKKYYQTANLTNQKQSFLNQNYVNTSDAINVSVLALSSNGQMIVDNCVNNKYDLNLTIKQDSQCLNYYSICQFDFYYSSSNQGDKCMNCTQKGCSKCYKDKCGLCFSQYVLNQLSNTCISCFNFIPGCMSCNGNIKTCIICYSEWHFQKFPEKDKCICQNKYYLSGTNCTLCENSIVGCQSCQVTQDKITNSNASIICTKCLQSQHRALDSNKTCACDKFYFENKNDKTCYLCDSFQICTKCINQKQCLSCNQQNNWQPNPINNSCLCKQNYSNVNNSCILCTLDGCVQCSEEQVCKSCNFNNGFKKQAINGKCQCQDDRIFNQTIKKCSLCSDTIIGCISCILDENDFEQSDNHKLSIQSTIKCQLCSNESHFKPFPVNYSCLCQTQYIFDVNNNSCKLCSSLIGWCQQCYSPINSTFNIKCATCNLTLNRVPSEDHYQCVCDRFYFQSNKSFQCQSCDINQNCVHCTGQNQCTQCDFNKHWIIKPQNGSCLCQKYYQKVNGSCILCKLSGCLACSAEQYCLKCNQKDGFQEDPVNGVCKCQYGKYINSATLTCQFCNSIFSDCLTCQTDGSKCLVCNQTAHRLRWPDESGKCLCQTSYKQNINKVCTLCSIVGCQYCLQDNNCTLCDKKQFFDPNPNNQRRCQCLQTRYLKNNTCLSCQNVTIGCKNCLNEQKCTSCDQTRGFQVNPMNNTCKCLSNTLYINKTCILCSKLIQNCIQCSQFSKINSLQNQAELSLLQIYGLNFICKKCAQGYYFSNQIQKCVCGQGDQWQMSENQCVKKSSNALLYVIIPIAAFIMIGIVYYCYRKNKAKLLALNYRAIKDASMITDQNRQAGDQRIIPRYEKQNQIMPIRKKNQSNQRRQMKRENSSNSRRKVRKQNEQNQRIAMKRQNQQNQQNQQRRPMKRENSSNQRSSKQKKVQEIIPKIG